MNRTATGPNGLGKSSTMKETCAICGYLCGSPRKFFIGKTEVFPGRDNVVRCRRVLIKGGFESEERLPDGAPKYHGYATLFVDAATWADAVEREKPGAGAVTHIMCVAREVEQKVSADGHTYFEFGIEEYDTEFDFTSNSVKGDVKDTADDAAVTAFIARMKKRARGWPTVEVATVGVNALAGRTVAPDMTGVR